MDGTRQLLCPAHHCSAVTAAADAVSFAGTNSQALKSSSRPYRPTKDVDSYLLLLLTGILDVLTKLGVVTASTKLAGCSSGALISTSHCAGVPTAEVYKAGQNLAHACRAQMSCSGTLDRQLRSVLETTIPTGMISQGQAHEDSLPHTHYCTNLVPRKPFTTPASCWSRAALVCSMLQLVEYAG